MNPADYANAADLNREIGVTGYAAPDRAARIAAIHSFADWLAAHPEAPMPTMVTAEHHITNRVEPDEYTRVMGALSAMRHVGIQPHEGERTVQGDLELATESTHGIWIIYRVAAHKDPQPAQRYLSRKEA